MTDTPTGTPRYFTTYTGVKLPFKLVNELTDAEIHNRNTYFVGWYEGERLNAFDKMVYGEREIAHRYRYHANGTLAEAEIIDIDDEVNVLRFDEKGAPL